MHAYNEIYLSEVVQTQGKLFDIVSQNFSHKDTADFINSYMKSKTRQFIDQSQAFVMTMDAKTLLEYFLETDKYDFKDGETLKGFMPDWIGKFYAYYQWFYNISSASTLKKIPLDFLKKAYFGLHDLQLDLAVKKVGKFGEF